MNNSQNQENRSLLGQKWSAASEWLASDRLRRVRAALFQGYILLALFGFAGLTLLAVTTPVFDPDVLLSQALQRYAPTWAGPLFYAISWPGFSVQSVVMIGCRFPIRSGAALGRSDDAVCGHPDGQCQFAGESRGRPPAPHR